MLKKSGLFRLFLLWAGLVGLFGFSFELSAKGFFSEDSVGQIEYTSLPKEAKETLSRIKTGGPFPYPGKDGSVFGNYEKRLPIKPRGYYLEYTVPSPKGKNRGAKRIIAGKGSHGDVKISGEYYYSNDHYQSFKRIIEP